MDEGRSTAQAIIDLAPYVPAGSGLWWGQAGAAHLRGATPEQATHRLIAIAAPESRDDLARSLTH